MGTSQITSNNCELSRWLKEPFPKKLGQRAGEVNVNNKKGSLGFMRAFLVS